LRGELCLQSNRNTIYLSEVQIGPKYLNNNSRKIYEVSDFNNVIISSFHGWSRVRAGAASSVSV
jgi:hypothetical protein